jgi:prepilin-type N-terminal cleavage/methylation domain-containing protein/prepilin-type processing-associated H-X9-DG protein
MKSSIKSRGFTLVELLVVITIILVLAGVTVTMTRKFKDKAATAKRMADVRQAGTILLAKASENNGQCRLFQGGSGNFEFRPFQVVMTDLGVDPNFSAGVNIMHWGERPKTNEHWNCRGVNFTNVPDLNAVWAPVSVKDSQGRSGNIWALTIGAVTRPGVYPLVIDSSTASGDEVFRINESNGDCVGLRESGQKANACMLDGSVRALDKADLKAAGFKRAYDNSTKPPKSISL